MTIERALFTIAGLHPSSGGPARSVPDLCAALGRAGVGVEIVTHDYGAAFGHPHVPAEKNVRTTFIDCSSPLYRRLQWSPEYKNILRTRCTASSPQVIHDTGIWLSTNRAAAVVAGELNIPRVVSPRGMLTGWALRHKGLKKRLAWAWYQRADLAGVRLFHATSRAEMESIRAAGLTQPVAVIPNGVEIPPERSAEGAVRKNSRRTLLFVGRIHPVKGLLNLVAAWKNLKPSGWRVVLAGRDEMGHTAELQTAVRQAGLAQDFEFVAATEGESRWELYRDADLFVLPSHTENFGIVVAEALACSVPVVATRGTPWAGLGEQRCGWWVDIGAEPLAVALREAMALEDEARREMGRRGREWMARDFSWEGVAIRMRAVYEWILVGGTKPEWVVE
jgi:glycosyltransferase involved in cell wall biosynthesis